MLLKNKPRNEYRLKDGTLVPGVTTVIGELRKPALDKWHWQCGKEGIGWPIPSDGTAGVGTIAHYRIACWITGEIATYDEKWKVEHIEASNSPFQSFCAYFDFRKAKPILTEYSCVHEKQRYGGTLDLLVETPEGVELWDIKTSKAVYPEYWIQLAAYKMLLDQDSKYRHCTIKPRVVLVPQDGRLETPKLSRAQFTRARDTWAYLIKMYHKLQAFRKAI